MAANLSRSQLISNNVGVNFFPSAVSSISGFYVFFVLVTKCNKTNILKAKKL
jgi:hypothetical protein